MIDDSSIPIFCGVAEIVAFSALLSFNTTIFVVSGDDERPFYRMQ